MKQNYEKRMHNVNGWPLHHYIQSSLENQLCILPVAESVVDKLDDSVSSFSVTTVATEGTVGLAVSTLGVVFVSVDVLVSATAESLFILGVWVPLLSLSKDEVKPKNKLKLYKISYLNMSNNI